MINNYKNYFSRQILFKVYALIILWASVLHSPALIIRDCQNRSADLVELAQQSMAEGRYGVVYTNQLLAFLNQDVLCTSYLPVS